MSNFKRIIAVLCIAATFAFMATSCAKNVEEEPETIEDVTDAGYEADTVADETVAETTTEETTVEETTTAETTTAETTAAETTTEKATQETTTVTTTAATTTQVTTTAASDSSGSFSAADIACTIKGVTIKPNTKWSNYESALGQPSDVMQAPSCHFDGMDNIYQYNGFAVYTYMNNNESYVYDIEITSSSIPTNKGIRVGSSASDVIAAYGTGYAENSDYLIEYTSGSKSIYFSMDGGKVSMIEFYCD